MREFRDTGYFAKEDGTIIGKQGRPLSKKRIRGEYQSVRISNGDITKGNMLTHIIVAECYYGPKPKGLVTDHIDGNKMNNHKDNLEYVTREENQKRAYRLGLQTPKTCHFRYQNQTNK